MSNDLIKKWQKQIEQELEKQKADWVNKQKENPNEDYKGSQKFKEKKSLQSQFKHLDIPNSNIVESKKTEQELNIQKVLAGSKKGKAFPEEIEEHKKLESQIKKAGEPFDNSGNKEQTKKTLDNIYGDDEEALPFDNSGNEKQTKKTFDNIYGDDENEKALPFDSKLKNLNEILNRSLQIMQQKGPEIKIGLAKTSILLQQKLKEIGTSLKVGLREVPKLDEIIDQYIKLNLLHHDLNFSSYKEKEYDNKETSEIKNYPIKNDEATKVFKKSRDLGISKWNTDIINPSNLTDKEDLSFSQQQSALEKSTPEPGVGKNKFAEPDLIFNPKYGYYPALLNWLVLLTTELFAERQGTFKLPFGIELPGTFKSAKYLSFLTFMQIYAFPSNRFYGKGKIYNPLSLFLSSIPILKDMFPIAIDTISEDDFPFSEALSGPGEKLFEPFEYYEVEEDKGNSDGDLFSEGKKPYKESKKWYDNIGAAQSIVDAGIRGSVIKQAKTDEQGSQRQPIKVTIGAAKRHFIYIPTTHSDIKKYWDRKTSVAARTSKSEKSSEKDYNGVSLFSNDLQVETSSTHTLIPFWFKDLRSFDYKMNEKDNASTIVNNKMNEKDNVSTIVNKYLTFNAFLNTLSEKLNPNVQSTGYYGRTDPIMISDTNVNRSVSVGFQAVAFYPQDMEIIWNKINWLSSMVYPSYKGLDVRQAPLIELRIGNFMCVNKYKGIPGKILSLNYTVNKEIPWELDEEMQLPQVLDISLEFQIYHAKPIIISVDNGKLNFEDFRSFEGAMLGKEATP